LFSLDDALVIRLVFDEEVLIRLHGIVQLECEKVFRIGQLFGQQGQDHRPKRD